MTGGRSKGKQSRRARISRVYIDTVDRERLDIPKFSRALILLAQAEAEAAAQAQHQAKQSEDSNEVLS